MKAKFRKVLLASLCAAGFVVSGQAVAQDPAGFLPAGSPIQFKYNDLEIVVTEEGEILSGIFTISSLGDPSGTPIYWASGLSGSELNGFFTGLVVDEIVPTVGGSEIYFIGGELTMYNVPIGSYDPSGPPVTEAQICATAPGGVCPAPWLTFDFIPGVVTTGTPSQNLATLFSTVTSLTAPLTGTGDGTLEVTGGTALATFGLGTTFSLQSNLQSCPTTNPDFEANCAGAGEWPLASFDPVVGRTVPEPGSLLLLGAALAGAGFMRRRGQAAQ